jgi:hypothetical protein
MWNERKKAAVKEMKEKDPDGYKLFFGSKNVKLAKSKYLKDILKTWSNNKILTFCLVSF